METLHRTDSSLLGQIIATKLLETRPAREPNFRLESEALANLAEVFANAPDELAQRLTETALRLTRAHAAGISLEEEGASPRRFRWIATAGSYARYLDGTMPWDFSHLR